MPVMSPRSVQMLTALLVTPLVPLYGCEKRYEGYSPNGSEPSLREKYSGFPSLPATRNTFDTAVAGAGLRAEERVKSYTDGGPLTCPTPLRATEEVRRRIEKCLLIHGKDAPTSSEQYVAFIDAGGSVIYVENWYQYSAR